MLSAEEKDFVDRYDRTEYTVGWQLYKSIRITRMCMLNTYQRENKKMLVRDEIIEREFKQIGQANALERNQPKN